MELAFREYGSGQPLIILHGLFGQSDNWNTLAKQFAEEQLHVFTIDQRNHGLSPHSAEWTYNAMADDLLEFIEKHRLTKPILLGHSMGAKTVMFLESGNRGISSKLIIADMAARSYPAHHEEVLSALNSINFSEITTRKEAESKLAEKISDFGTRQFLLKNIYWKDSDNSRMDWRFNLKVITKNYDQVRVEVPPFVSEVPTLIIRGGKSGYVNASDLADFEIRFPNHQVKTIEGAGHWLHAEKPAEFLQACLEFIKA